MSDVQLERIGHILGEAAVPRAARGGQVDVQADQLGAAISLAIRSEESFQANNYEEALRFLKEADRLVAVDRIKARIADCYFHLGD